MKNDVTIVGGGPAGMLMGLLLAKENIKVVVLEKNNSLKRDFRGETIAPGSVYILKMLGVYQELEKHGFIKVNKIKMYDQEKNLFNVDFNRFNHPQKYGIDMPQPVVLEAIKRQAMKYPSFQYINGANCTDLIKENGKVVGVQYKHEGEIKKIHSQLVIGAEGRFSQLRSLAEYDVKKEEFSRDLIWFKVPKPLNWEEGNLIKVYKNDHVIILPTYPNYLRVGTYISLGDNANTKSKGLDSFIEKVSRIEPRLLTPMKDHITSWKDTTLLKIFTAHVDKWAKDGIILIGDSAHTLSPILGQGVNIAMQDAYELTPYVVKGLSAYQNSPIPASHFDEFVSKRKQQISFVSSFQARQEQNLAASSPVECAIRKWKMKMLDRTPFKYTVMKKLQYGIVANNKVEV
ncbi:FAD-dependent oxidoreductase [Guptibacillus spartinae]|uniref:FAD-dependent oxidoreductase n=1 Tax=Guptibacillus spartinae TaxID=3025679 RepID=UPI0023618ED0|nr:FAD-dependent oxidoreductase [Pseudalkalibacillus spartinae]